jgi:hypothetical protein
MKDVVWQGRHPGPRPPPLIITDPFGGANTRRWPSRRDGFKQLAISLLLRGNGYASRSPHGTTCCARPG